MNTPILQQQPESQAAATLTPEEEILRTCRLLMAPGAVHELRIPKAGREKTVSGYFDSPEKLAEAALKLDSRNYAGIYITLNPCKPELLARRYNRIEPYADPTTSDPDALRRVRILIDFDPRRPSGISSSDAEHSRAIAVAYSVRDALRAEGWPDPIVADSGNGCHLIYTINLENTAEAAQLIQRVLKGIAERYATADVDVDLTVYNAARITKVYGTTTRKGDNTPERPHRRSRLLEIPPTPEEVTVEMMERVAVNAAEKPKPGPFVVTAGGFTALQFMEKHGLQLRREKAASDRTVYELTECPFNPEHNAGEAAIYQFPDGKPGFSCKHNSCSGKDWHELRELLEPGHKERRAKGNGKLKDAAPKDEPANESEPEVKLSPAELVQMVAGVEGFIRKYVVLPEDAYLPLAMWVIGTHAVKLFECFAYLALLSPTKQCGKTRMLEVLEVVVHRPFRTTAPSPAVLFRMLARVMTLLLDEVEGLKSGKNKSESAEAVLSVLNSGHRVGNPVYRCEGPNHEPTPYDVYGAKAFATIGRLPDTLADRSIIVTMQRRTKGQEVGRFQIKRATAEAKPLQGAMAGFVKSYRTELVQAYECTPDLKFLSDRDADIWRPLFAVCIVAAPDQVGELARCAITLSGSKAEDDAKDSRAIRLLTDIKAVWPKDTKHWDSKSLVGALRDLEESPWAEYDLTQNKLARWLRDFGVEPRSVRDGKETPKGYVYASLEAAFERYL
jgi:Protein of unknown function (DUF3631)